MILPNASHLLVRSSTRIAIGLGALCASVSAQCLGGTCSDAVVPGELHVVYSEMVTVPAGELANTSNLYVLRGAALDGGVRRIWVFGSGYGDPNGDVLAYRQNRDAAQNALFDAANVADVISTGFGLEASEVVISFLAPHGHLDHVNQEIFTAFSSLGFVVDQILIHAADEVLATCNTGSPCCGTANCQEGQNEFFGSPYDPSWDAATLALVQTIGEPGNTCQDVILSFPTAGLGTAIVRADPGHTGGTIDLLLPSAPEARYFLRGGAKTQSCRTDTWLVEHGWTVLQIHGRL